MLTEIYIEALDEELEPHETQNRTIRIVLNNLRPANETLAFICSLVSRTS